MNGKERVQAILNRQAVDRLPVDLWYTPEIYSALSAHFGVDTEDALHRAMGLDKIVWINPAPPAHEQAAGAERNIWGAELRTIDTGTAVYQEIVRNPLAGYDTPEALEGFPYWPDPAGYDYEGTAEEARAIHEDYATIGPWVSFYEIYCMLRGLEQALMDLLAAPDLVDAILDRVEACQTDMLKRFLDKTAAHMDLVFISDDMGSQNGLLISLDAWDRFFKDRMRRWCDLIHGYGVKVFFHSDGACADLVPRLIEAGIDVLNPIQHRCPGMDMAMLKREYGKDIIFHGGVDNQDVLPFGSAADVRRETRNCMETLGGDGAGFICCSCHNVQPGTPVENILTMVETVHAGL